MQLPKLDKIPPVPKIHSHEAFINVTQQHHVRNYTEIRIKLKRTKLNRYMKVNLTFIDIVSRVRLTFAWNCPESFPLRFRPYRWSDGYLPVDV